MEEKQECKFSDLIVTPARLDFENEEGSGFVPPPQDLFIKKAGGEGVLDAGWSLHITCQGPKVWLDANPMGGRGTGRARVFIKSGELAPGGWEGQIEVKIEETLRDKVSVTPSVIPVRCVVRAKEPAEPEPPVEPPEEPEEPGEPPEKPPEEPPEEPPTEPPEEPPPQPPTEPPGEGCWLWRLIKKLLKLWSR